MVIYGQFWKLNDLYNGLLFFNVMFNGFMLFFVAIRECIAIEFNGCS